MPTPVDPNEGEDLFEKLNKAVKSLLEREVQTVLGATEWDGTAEALSLPDGGSVTGLRTTINMLDGDVTTVGSADALSEKNAALQTYHAQMVQRSDETIERNIDAVIKLADWLRQRNKLDDNGNKPMPT